jgi:hypothetical protein
MKYKAENSLRLQFSGFLPLHPGSSQLMVALTAFSIKPETEKATEVNRAVFLYPVATVC